MNKYINRLKNYLLLLLIPITLKPQNTFIENKGQLPISVISKTILPQGALFVEKGKFTYVFYNGDQLSEKHSLSRKKTIQAHSYTATFQNINPNSNIKLEGASLFFENYFLGEKRKWATNVKSYQRHIQENIYQGVDMIFYTHEKQLKFELHVAPKIKTNQIKIKYEGLNSIEVINNTILCKTSFSTTIEHNPIAFQIINNDTINVLCKYKLNKRQQIISFDFPEGYNPNYKLVIDPTLEFSTYSGSTADNFGYTATYDNYGFLYSGSTVFGVGYPTTLGAYDISYSNSNGGTDIAITKYDTTGTQRIYSTYLGGDMDELPHSMIVNSADELFVYGTTGSNNFPTTSSAYQTFFKGGASFSPSGIGASFPNGSDIFVSRLSSNGGALLASTFIGGSGNDGLNTAPKLKYNYADEVRGEIDIDKQNNIYIVSSTHSLDFPIKNGLQNNLKGGQEGCVIKMDNELNSIIWSSYLGGDKDDAIYSLAIDDSSNIYVTGGTNSDNFPTTNNAYLNNYQDSIKADAFIAKINSQGTQLISSSYYGTEEYDQSYFVEIGSKKNIYLFGQTKATGATLVHNVNYFQPNGGQFIAVFSNNLSSLLRSTVVGSGKGTPDISPTAFLVDVCDKIYISGWGSNLGGSLSTLNLPYTSDAYQSTTDGNDFYLMVLDDLIDTLLYATYFGGTQSNEHVDGGTSRFDKKGVIYQSVCAGCGGNSDFPIEPTAGAVSSTNNSFNCNNAVFKFNFDFPMTIADFIAPYVGCNLLVSFQNVSSTPGGAIYLWDFGDGNTSFLENPTHNYSAPGIYEIVLVVSDITSCNISDTIVKQIYILSNSSDTLNMLEKCLNENIQIGLMPVSDPTINYTWTPNNGLTSTNVANPFCNINNDINYQLIITNGGCTDTLLQQITVINPQFNTIQDTSFCNDSILLYANNLLNIDSIFWSENISFNNILSGDTSLFVLDTGIYYVKGIKASCHIIDSIQVKEGDIFLQVPKDTTYCNESIRLTAIYDTIKTVIFWSYNNDFSDTISQNNYIDIFNIGTYYVSAKQGICIKEDSVQVVSENINIDLFSNDVCFGDVLYIGVNNLNPEVPIVSYEWSDFLINNSSIIDTARTSKWFVVSVVNTEGCKITDSIFVSVADYPVINDLYINDTIVFLGEEITIKIDMDTIANNVLVWNDFNNNNLTQKDYPSSDYCYKIEVYNSQNCITKDSVCVKVEDVFCDEKNIIIPTAFSPNNDNVNDTYFIYDEKSVVTDFKIEIYNRLGQRIFYSTDIYEHWDGKYLGKELAPQVFDFYTEINCIGEKRLFKKGNITLIK